MPVSDDIDYWGESLQKGGNGKHLLPSLVSSEALNLSQSVIWHPPLPLPTLPHCSPYPPLPVLPTLLSLLYPPNFFLTHVQESYVIHKGESLDKILRDTRLIHEYLGFCLLALLLQLVRLSGLLKQPRLQGIFLSQGENRWLRRGETVGI